MCHDGRCLLTANYSGRCVGLATALSSKKKKIIKDPATTRRLPDDQQRGGGSVLAGTGNLMTS